MAGLGVYPFQGNAVPQRVVAVTERILHGEGSSQCKVPQHELSDWRLLYTNVRTLLQAVAYSTSLASIWSKAAVAGHSWSAQTRTCLTVDHAG